jgi:hypothetical protein
MAQYLSAYFGEALPEAAVAAVSEPGAGGLEQVRVSLERSYAQDQAAAAGVAGELLLGCRWARWAPAPRRAASAAGGGCSLL